MRTEEEILERCDQASANYRENSLALARTSTNNPRFRQLLNRGAETAIILATLEWVLDKPRAARVAESEAGG